MKIPDVLKYSLQGVSEQKFRFALNLVGVLIGCAAITGLITVTLGLSANVEDQLSVFGPQNIMVIPGRVIPGRGVVSSTLNWRDLDLVKRIHRVAEATPVVANKFCTFTVKKRLFRAEVIGITEQYADINKEIKIAQGRNFMRGDRNVAIVGANIAHPRDLDDPIINLGNRIKIKVQVQGQEKEVTLRIIGIVERTGLSFGVNIDNSVVLPLQTAQQLYGVAGEFDYIVAQASTLEDVDEASANIKERFGDRVSVVTAEFARQQIDSILGVIQQVLGGVAAISLLVAGVGIINTMTVSVKERVKEIGTMKAIGAKSRDVMYLFMFEALYTGVLGGLLGASLGFGIGVAVGNYIGLPVKPRLIVGVLTVCFAVVTSVASGIYPAWRASKLSPVEALRNE